MSKTVGRLLLMGMPLAIAAVVVGLIIMLSITAPQPERAEPEIRPAAVFVAEAERQPVTLQVRARGEVKPLTEIDLTAQVAGMVDWVNPSFVEGGFFEAGETLIRLEDADYRLAVTRAEALVAQRRQQLIREQAEAELAAQEWEAIGEGEASPLTLREPQLADARAQLAAAEASLAEARLNLDRTSISAPFSGRVRTKAADLGQYVGPGSRLGRVFSTERVEVSLPLSDSELAQLGIPVAFSASDSAPGPEVVLSATVAGERREWTGRVARTGGAIDPTTRTLAAVVQVEGPYEAAADAAGAPLAVGLFVEAELAGRRIDNAFVLPRGALRGSDEIYVATDERTLDIRTATVLQATRERVVLTGGVREGERVITSAVRGAAQGMPLRLLDQSGQPLEPEDAPEPPEAAAVAAEAAGDAQAG